MTKEEIKALVAAKIAGQGSAIDAASVLPAILNGIIDAIPNSFIDLGEIGEQYILTQEQLDRILNDGAFICNGLIYHSSVLPTSILEGIQERNYYAFINVISYEGEQGTTVGGCDYATIVIDDKSLKLYSF